MAQSDCLDRTTALIVEDEALIRFELADQLSEMGLRVLLAADADEAIALLDIHPEIELLVTDIKMPGSMDGIRLAHHTRLRWPPVKIIVLSGRGDIQPSELPRDSILLAKPYGHTALTEALSHMMYAGAPRGPSPLGLGA